MNQPALYGRWPRRSTAAKSGIVRGGDFERTREARSTQSNPPSFAAGAEQFCIAAVEAADVAATAGDLSLVVEINAPVRRDGFDGDVRRRRERAIAESPGDEAV